MGKFLSAVLTGIVVGVGVVLLLDNEPVAKQPLVKQPLDQVQVVNEQLLIIRGDLRRMEIQNNDHLDKIGKLLEIIATRTKE